MDGSASRYCWNMKSVNGSTAFSTMLTSTTLPPNGFARTYINFNKQWICATCEPNQTTTLFHDLSNTLCLMSDILPIIRIQLNSARIRPRSDPNLKQSLAVVSQAFRPLIDMKSILEARRRVLVPGCCLRPESGAIHHISGCLYITAGPYLLSIARPSLLHSIHTSSKLA